VPYAHLASVVLVPADGALWLLESAPPVTPARYERTDRALAADLALDGAPGVALGAGAADRLLLEAWLGLAAVGLGVGHEALAQTARYLSQRRQFGVPLATFQAAAHQAANCHIDVQAMEVTLWSALWRMHTGRPVGAAAHVAKWWAAEAGDRVARTVQHLHGGIGSDVTYPIHRYMLWTSQLANTAGGASWHMTRIGDLIAAGEA
jgi:alkylation response protein AidB-like acyl-CoA dehydrogenase